MKQGTEIVSAQASRGTWIRVAFNFVIPCTVVNWGYLSARRVPVPPPTRSARSTARSDARMEGAHPASGFPLRMRSMRIRANPMKEDGRMTQETDVVVIGMGPGGEHVAGRLAEAGQHVTGIEAELVGGECPYWGCIPSKMMIRAGNLLAEARRIPGIAGRVQVAPEWGQVAARIRDEATDDWNDQVAVDRFIAKGGHFVRGRGVLAGPGRVEVAGQTYAARRGVVVATGTRPWAPPVPGLDQVPYWTNREAISAKVPGCPPPEPVPRAQRLLPGRSPAGCGTVRRRRPMPPRRARRTRTSDALSYSTQRHAPRCTR